MTRQPTLSPSNAAAHVAPDASMHAFAHSVSDRIEQVPTERLKSLDRRSRTHSDDQIARIMGSICAFGFVNPVIVDEASRVLAGNARVEAARRLGLATVPAVIASHLTADEKRAYAIADNRLAELAGWDKEILAIELKELSAIEFDFEMDIIGFSIGEIDVLVGEADAASDTDDVLPPAPPCSEAVTQIGDLWQLGHHRLLCGNSLHAASFTALLAGDKARMVLADPPFNVPIDGFVGGLGAVRHREFAMASGEMTQAEFTSFLTEAIARMVESTVDGGLLYLFMDWRHELELLLAARAVGVGDHNLCVWNKLSGGMGSHYRSQHELCRIFKVGTAPHVNTVELGRHGRNRTNVWDHPGMSSFGRGRNEALASHPTVKPVGLLAEAIKDCTRRGDLVLDPFLGSGSTVVAAERTGRRAAGIELDPLYCDTIIRRFEKMTGDKAVHAASGMTFAALAAERKAMSDDGHGTAPVGSTACAATPAAATFDGNASPTPAIASNRVRIRTRPVPGSASAASFS